MMSTFVASHKGELIRRCAAKVGNRPRREATAEQLSNGVPHFLDQLQRTLEAEERQEPLESERISGTSGGQEVSEMGVSAAMHGKYLLELGFSVDQVVHDYGDLCQAITDLAFELGTPIAVSEFRTLNRSLDNAIASAVSAFSLLRDQTAEARQHAEVNERVGTFMHELQSSLASATYAVAALQLGNLPVSGSTGNVLKRSLAAMRNQLGGPTLDEVILASGSQS